MWALYRYTKNSFLFIPFCSASISSVYLHFLKAECSLKTDSGYPKQAGVTMYSSTHPGKPFVCLFQGLFATLPHFFSFLPSWRNPSTSTNILWHRSKADPQPPWAGSLNTKAAVVATVCIYIHIYIYIYIFAYIFAHIYMRIYIYMYIYIHVYIYICIYTCIYIHICIYIYVHICIHILRKRLLQRLQQQAFVQGLRYVFSSNS